VGARFYKLWNSSRAVTTIGLFSCVDIPAIMLPMVERLSQHRRYRKQLHLLGSALAGILGLGSLVACSIADNTKTLPTVTMIIPGAETATEMYPTMSAAGIGTATAFAHYWAERATAYALTPTPISRSELATRVAIRQSQFRTAIALTPPITKGPAAWGTPGPTSTVELGMLSGCPPPANPRQPEFVSCWRGVINGHYVDVQTGRYTGEGAQSQGILMVNVWRDNDYSTLTRDIYETQERVGTIRIVSVEGTRFTLSPYDHRTPGPTATPGVTFVFDLSTRQWVNP